MAAWRPAIGLMIAGAVLGMLFSPLAAGHEEPASSVVTADLDVRGPTQIRGLVDLDVEAKMIALTPAPDQDGATAGLAGEFHDGRVRWIGAPRTDTDLGPAPVGPFSRGGTQETWWDDQFTGEFRIVSWFDDAFVLILPADENGHIPWRIEEAVDARVSQPLSGSVGTPLEFWSPSLGRALEHPKGTMMLSQERSVNATVAGSLVVALYGVEVQVMEDGQQRRIVTGEHVSPDSVTVPITGQGVTQYNRSLLVIETGTQRGLSLLASLAPTVATTHVSGVVDGAAWFAGVDGALEQGDESRFASGGLLEFDGVFELESNSGGDDPPGSHWRLGGEPRAIRLDTQAVQVGVPRGVDVAVQATLIGAVSGFMGWAVWHFRDVAFAVFQKTRKDPLANKMRRRVLDILAEKGPQTKRKLAQKVRLSKQGVEFHLRILERAKLVLCDSTGVAEVYYRAPNGTGGSTPSLGKADVLAATHPLRHALWKQVLRNGDAEYDELLPLAEGLLGNKARAARSLKYHTEVLVDAGLLRREGEGRSTRLVLTPEPLERGNGDGSGGTKSTSGT